MTPYDSIANEHAENPLVIVEDPNSSQLSGAKRFSESTAEMRQSSKKSKRYAEVPQDLYARIPGNAASSKHHSKGTDVFYPGTPNHLLPVLGLCAPNADQVNSYKNSLSGPSIKEHKKASGDIANKPLSTAADHSSEYRNEAQSASNKAVFPGASEDALRRLNNIIPDSYFPFTHVCSLLCFLHCHLFWNIVPLNYSFSQFLAYHSYVSSQSKSL
jgi:chromodomain-helicase-DNA-binding protein 4/chromodomain-helicase-DNA-binding protein 5